MKKENHSIIMSLSLFTRCKTMCSQTKILKIEIVWVKNLATKNTRKHFKDKSKLHWAKSISIKCIFILVQNQIMMNIFPMHRKLTKFHQTSKKIKTIINTILAEETIITVKTLTKFWSLMKIFWQIEFWRII